MRLNNYLKFKSFQLVTALATFFFVANVTWAQDILKVKRVNPVSNPLIDSLVGNLVGEGVKVSNIKSNLKQTTHAMGTFKAPEQLFGIKEGLVMVTGFADTISGANNGGIMSYVIPPTDTLPGLPIGRQLLNQVLSYNASTTSPTRTTNCATIQFDIIPSADSIKFNYVFASEEYNSFVCSDFNDIFGFFISGPEIVGDVSLAPFPGTKNIAIIPGTDLPVSINTVNNGDDPDPEGLCNITPEGVNAFIDNTEPDLNPYIYERLKFNGLTRKLTAAVKVVPCQTYTLTLTISDVADGSWDSGVFIEKGSLRSGYKTTASSTYSTRFPYSIINCNPGKFIVDRTGGDTSEALLIRYSIEGTAVNGVDYMQLLPNGTTQPLQDNLTLEPGVVTDTITLVGIDGPSWTLSEEKTVHLKFVNAQVPVFNGQPNYCGDSVKMFIRKRFLYDAGPDKKICQFTDTSLIPVSGVISSDYYVWREVTATGDTIVPTDLSCTTCSTPIATNTTTKRYIVYVIDSISRCVTNDTVLVDVYNNPTLTMTTDKPDNAACENTNINLFANPPTADTSWKYKWEPPLEGNILIGNASNLLQRNIRVNIGVPQYYYVTATNFLGCTKTDSLLVSIKQIPAFQLPITDTVCYKQPIQIKATNVKDSLLVDYSWMVKENTITRVIDSNQTYLTLRPTKSGLYILTGQNDCFSNSSAADTFNLVVMDSISAAHTYTLLNDNFTVAPVQFTSSYFPQSYQRMWTLKNLSQPWDTVLLGNEPLVELRKGGDYESQAIIYSQMGNYYCGDTVTHNFHIDPLGTVFVPNLVLEGGTLLNSTFTVTARGENGEILRNITDGKLTIYNRWGKKVYEKENYNNDLDSKKLKDDFTDGIYFFEFSVARYNYRNGGWLNIQQK